MKMIKQIPTQFLAKLDAQAKALSETIPPKSEVHHFIDELFDFLFAINGLWLGNASDRLDKLMGSLTRLIKLDSAEANSIVISFFIDLPELYERMLEDAHAALALDPAAKSLAEVIAAYPGFTAIAIYRVAHQLDCLGVPVLPRMLTEYAHGKTGIDIHPTAKIGRAFVIDHGTGVVIGATAQIGNHVTLYHGVTLGALQVKKSEACVKRHPTVEDHVTIYANATVLGGKTVIGTHSVIGGNVWVTRSVPANSRILHESKSKVKSSMDRLSTDSALAQQSIQKGEPNPFTKIFIRYKQAVDIMKVQGRRLFLISGSA